jgi:hypothetical protein
MELGVNPRGPASDPWGWGGGRAGKMPLLIYTSNKFFLKLTLIFWGLENIFEIDCELFSSNPESWMF